MNFTVLTTKGSLSSEGILALVSLPKKGAKSYPAANVQFDEEPTKLKIHSEIFSYLKKHLARYELKPNSIKGNSTTTCHFLTHPLPAWTVFLPCVRTKTDIS
jgi:hypothetical protein